MAVRVAMAELCDRDRGVEQPGRVDVMSSRVETEQSAPDRTEAYYRRDDVRPPLPSTGGMSRRAGFRRWPALVAALILVVLAAVAVRAMTVRLPNLVLRVAYTTTVRLPGSAPKPTWPASGQAALVVPGIGSLGSAGGNTPRPIASVAKVMTAYLTLKRYPLNGAGGGFTLTVTPAEARAEKRDAKHDESVVAVRAGEQLDERQLLEALLIPSGDNIARMLAEYEAGSVSRFVVKMNLAARALGMHKTTYTDPSGYEPTTVSDARDQLRLFEHAMSFAVFRRIVSMSTVTLPVAGTVKNYDPVIAEGYEGKTGSDSAAGGCLAFFKHVTVAGRRVTLVGVVLGQGQGGVTSVILTAAAAAAERLVGSVTPAIGTRTVLPARTAVMVASAADGRRVTAATRHGLRVIGWGGLQEQLTLHPGRLGTDLSAGQRVGEAALAGTLPTAVGDLIRTPVRASAALGAPGIAWRLRHLL
jgi:D-alanyl-D-alanine carboxypeptidase (penicillin-binding protein 5/6)